MLGWTKVLFYSCGGATSGQVSNRLHCEQYVSPDDFNYQQRGKHRAPVAQRAKVVVCAWSSGKSRRPGSSPDRCLQSFYPGCDTGHGLHHRVSLKRICLPPMTTLQGQRAQPIIRLGAARFGDRAVAKLGPLARL